MCVWAKAAADLDPTFCLSLKFSGRRQLAKAEI
jgi:hypothetical protein